jgi:long-subunit acyl-CoA synthetase (AMP-forming)
VLVLDEHLRPQLGDPVVRDRVETALTRLLNEVNDGLASHERLQMLVVVKEPCSIESGTLTPTMNIKLACIEAQVADAVDGWYLSGAPVVWA